MTVSMARWFTFHHRGRPGGAMLQSCKLRTAVLLMEESIMRKPGTRVEFEPTVVQVIKSWLKESASIERAEDKKGEKETALTSYRKAVSVAETSGDLAVDLCLG